MIAKKARESFTEGTASFNLGQWDKAIEAWQKGYQLKQDPIFLYNIGQAYRKAENFERAIFFYKNYLRNAPKAPNREEVEQWIDQLQKLLEEQRRAKTAPPEDAMKESGTVSTPAAREGATLSTSTGGGTSGQAPPVASTTAQPQAVRSRRVDLSVSAGADIWLGSMPTPLPVNRNAGYTGTQILFSFSVSGGYTFFTRDRLSLRAGLRFGYSSLPDQRKSGILNRCVDPSGNQNVTCATTDHLISVLAEPTLRLRLFRERLYGFVSIGFGALVFTGVEAGSFWLPPSASLTGDAVTTRAAFELRPSLGLEIRITQLFGVLVSPTVVYSPKPADFAAPGAGDLVRFEVQAGGQFRF